jgi:hypothetical protein
MEGQRHARLPRVRLLIGSASPLQQALSPSYIVITPVCRKAGADVHFFA